MPRAARRAALKDWKYANGEMDLKADIAGGDIHGWCNGDGTLGDIKLFLRSPRLSPPHGTGTQLASMPMGTSNRRGQVCIAQEGPWCRQMCAQIKAPKLPFSEPSKGS